jgi:hypothetical protein
MSPRTWAYFWHWTSLSLITVAFVNGIAGHYEASALNAISSILAFRLALDLTRMR